MPIPKNKQLAQKKFLATRPGYGKNAYRKSRQEVIDHYGGCCACCGENNFEFLAIDHIEGGGKAHHKVLAGTHIHYWLKRNNYPKGFRVLCHNCNQAIGAYGYCPPHQKKEII